MATSNVLKRERDPVVLATLWIRTLVSVFGEVAL